jgi:hypothetical protein
MPPYLVLIVDNSFPHTKNGASYQILAVKSNEVLTEGRVEKMVLDGELDMLFISTFC